MNTDANPHRRDLLELAAGYAEQSVIVTTPEAELPGPEILYVNTSFTRMTGYSASELIGQTPRILQGPATDRTQLDRLKSELAAGNDFIARTTNYRRDGSPFQIEWIITHLRNDDGNTTHYVAVQRDITGIERAAEALQEVDAELRELGAQLVAAVRDLQQAEIQMARAERMNAMGRLARGITHDLTNSLGPASLVLGVLAEDDELTDEQLNHIHSAQANIGHALALLDLSLIHI